ncbi:MAG: hypothetical protein AB8B74_03210 [Crocinitomicaceae bacterium]
MRIIFFSFILFMGPSIFAQVSKDTSDVSQKPIVKVTKNDGVVYFGQIIKDDGREILLRTKTVGDLYIIKTDIKLIEEIAEKEMSNTGKYREEAPFKTRYYFTNNALPIEKGDHYGMVHLYGPEVHFAVTDRLSVGLMATWIASPIGLALKYAIPTQNEKVNLSLGTIMLSSGYLNQARSWGGLHWGTVTYGSVGKNISISSGVGYVNLGLNNFNNRPDNLRVASVSSVAGIFPVGAKASFIFDSMIALSERRNYSNLYGFQDSQGNNVEAPELYSAGTELTSFFMPGMRFQSSSTRAFQIALAGVFQYSSIGFNYSSFLPSVQKTRSFPIPMCSWFFIL